MRFLTFFILATIYLYDRWILKPEKMKRKYIIVLAVQSILILLMLTYAFVQKAQADRSRQDAFEEQQRAIEIEKKYQELLNEKSR